jgi:hypothetical protein
VDPDPDHESMRAKMTHNNKKSLKVSRFEVLDVLFEG